MKTKFRFMVIAAALALAGSRASAAPPVARTALAHEPLRLPIVLDDGRGYELEALRVRPAALGRYPLALLTHGTPRVSDARRRMSAADLSFQAEEVARRGYVTVVVMRRGYGTSEGAWEESSGPCDSPDHERAARESARDLRAALRTIGSWPEIDASRAIVIGQSAGGIGAVALAADPPPSLKAVINFAGGRGSRGPNDVCGEDRLVSAYAALGRTARVPTLWIYTENDLYFGPALARRMFAAYREQGGIGVLHMLAPFGEDGHALFARRGGVPKWRPVVDSFLRQHRLPTWDTPPNEPAVAELPAPAELGAKYRAHWARYLESSDNKAFAISPNGRFAWRSGQYSIEKARTAALQACGEAACRIVSENDLLTAPALAANEAPAR